jgi:hypothetical protein
MRRGSGEGRVDDDLAVDPGAAGSDPLPRALFRHPGSDETVEHSGRALVLVVRHRLTLRSSPDIRRVDEP